MRSAKKAINELEKRNRDLEKLVIQFENASVQLRIDVESFIDLCRSTLNKVETSLDSSDISHLQNMMDRWIKMGQERDKSLTIKELVSDNKEVGLLIDKTFWSWTRLSSESDLFKEKTGIFNRLMRRNVTQRPYREHYTESDVSTV